MDNPASAADAHPPRAVVISWLKLNLAVTAFILSLASAISGAAITVTVRIVNTQHDIEMLDDRIGRIEKLAERRQAQWNDQARTDADIDRRLVRLETRADHR